MRRRDRATLTPAGRALQQPLTECAAAVNSLARRGLTQAQVAMLFDVVEAVIDNLRKAVVG
jgi:hypothetical protein